MRFIVHSQEGDVYMHVLASHIICYQRNLLVMLILASTLSLPIVTQSQQNTLLNILDTRRQYEVSSAEFTLYDPTLDRTILILARYPTDAYQPLPVVIWSHGAPPDVDGTRHLTSGAAFATILAESGYVVVHVSHAPVQNPEALCASLRVTAQQCPDDGRSELLMRLIRPNDISIVVDHLVERSEQLPVRIDTDRIALAGHSFGAYTTMMAAGAVSTFTVSAGDFPIALGDARIRAFIALSPQGPGRYGFDANSWDEIERPVLSITGTGDDTGAEQSEDRRVPFDNMPAGEKYLLYVDDPRATHETFGLQTESPITTIVAGVSLAFLDRQFAMTNITDVFLMPETVANATEGSVTLEAKPAAPPQPLSSYRWSRDVQTPALTSSGDRLTGTEVMHLESFNGSLYASNSFWGESMLPLSQQRAEIWRLDAADSEWVLDYRLPERYTRGESMKTLTLATGSDGRPLAQGPISALMVGGHYVNQRGEGVASVFLRTSSGEWHQQDIATYTGERRNVVIRSIGQYRDTVTGVDRVFVGVSPAPLGVYSAEFNPETQALEWTSTPEVIAEGTEQRFMGFAECGGRLFAATSSRIYVRQDGEQPRWQPLLDVRREQFGASYPQEHLITEDVRAPTCVQDAAAGQPVLLFAWLTKILRLDLASYTVSVEADLVNVMSSTLNRPVGYVQINEMSLVDGALMIGTEFIWLNQYNRIADQPYFVEFGTAIYAHQGVYVVRRVTDGQVVYTAESIQSASLPDPEVLIRVRTMVASPFEAGVVYAGGYAPRQTLFSSRDLNNTAWIYRGDRQ